MFLLNFMFCIILTYVPLNKKSYSINIILKEKGK